MCNGTEMERVQRSEMCNGNVLAVKPKSMEMCENIVEKFLHQIVLLVFVLLVIAGGVEVRPGFRVA